MEVEKAQSLLIFFDIQDFCFRKRKHDPSKSARTLADIEQHDKTVFFDAPGGVVESPRRKIKLGPNDINPDYLNVKIDEENITGRRSPMPVLAHHNSVLRQSEMGMDAQSPTLRQYMPAADDTAVEKPVKVQPSR